MQASNAEIAKLLRSVAAALTIKKGNFFKIRSYGNAADGIEHLTSEIKDLWEENKLDLVPGLGKSLSEHLSELFKTGKVKHFEDIKRGIPEGFFKLLDIPGVGPKTAQELSSLGIKDLEDLNLKLENGSLVKKGFSEKKAKKLEHGLKEISSHTGRMLLPYAAAQAEKILAYLKKSPEVLDADPLGSLRRQVATIGDLDFAASSYKPEEVIKYFVKVPGVPRIVDQGENRATVILTSGLQADLLIGRPECYGALLQHFTGSKHHNIALRSFAEKKGFSISEYGVKSIKSGQISSIRVEEELYKILGMDTPPAEIREDSGEIEAAIAHKLPQLVVFKEVKGDLHLHSSFPFPSPSHGPGINPIEEIIEKAKFLGYQYVGISDHPPAYGKHSAQQLVNLVKKRTKVIQKLKQSTKSIHILNGLEIDILADGSLSVPDQALTILDYCIAGIHSGHRDSKDIITKRLLKALESPFVDIISHPTNRLLNERDSSEVDWEVIFKVCVKFNKLLEINAYPNRLDLRDDLVRLALKFGVKFIINTDAHEVSQMDNMIYGVSVARRGWAEAKDIVNTWDWKKFAEWFKINT